MTRLVPLIILAPLAGAMLAYIAGITLTGYACKQQHGSCEWVPGEWRHQ